MDVVAPVWGLRIGSGVFRARQTLYFWSDGVLLSVECIELGSGDDGQGGRVVVESGGDCFGVAVILLDGAYGKNRDRVAVDGAILKVGLDVHVVLGGGRYATADFEGSRFERIGHCYVPFWFSVPASVLEVGWFSMVSASPTSVGLML